MTLKAVLFDAADTLFRVRGSVGAVYASVAAGYGVTMAPADIEARFRAAFRAMPPLGFPDAGADDMPRHEYAWWEAVVRTAFGGVHFADFDAFFADLYARFGRAEVWEVFADVRPALAQLRARGLRLAVVSNFDGRLTEICHDLGLATVFDTLVMSGRVGWAKPDPRIFHVALDRLGIEAAEAVHVGDSEPEDVAGAGAAGIAAFWLRRDDPTVAGPTCITDLRQLPERLTPGTVVPRS